ncbi:MAG: hypothetical protein GY858_05325 [Candidatus Omnitrophica bacterium]|nr:hypothetical protein [Candidatus Omnitrophota bacterium]
MREDKGDSSRVKSSESQIIDYFRFLNKTGNLGASYLFIGDDYNLIWKVLTEISCENTSCGVCWDCKQIESGSHPDLCVVQAESIFIKIEQIRDARRFLSLKSYCLKRKLLVVKGAENLNPASANAFLKTLEEPPNNSFIAVCACRLDGLLPTIISRCRKIFLPGKANAAGLVSPDLISRFIKGERVKFANRKQFSSFLWTFSLLLRDHITAKIHAGNNPLLKGSEYEIILPSLKVDKASRILEKTLEIYGVYNTVNENLALNLIRAEL